MKRIQTIQTRKKRFTLPIPLLSITLLLITLLLLTSSLLSGCSFGASGTETDSGQNEGDSDAEETKPEDISYVFYCRSPKNQETVLLYPGMEPSAAIEQLGEPLSYYEAPSCALAGMDQIYTYSGFELTVSTELSSEETSFEKTNFPEEGAGSEIRILTAVRLTDDSFTTAEGIYIGSGITELLTAYEKTDAEPESGEYRFTKGEMELAFLTKNQSVISIEYRLLP